LNDVLTREKIIEAAEDVFRRFGPQKTNVVDVARLLGVSHGSVYRHFESKASLRDAVVEGWLKRVSEPLQKIAASNEPAEARLHRWLIALHRAKRKKVTADPEMFRVTEAIFDQVHEVVRNHLATLVGQVERIVRDGVADGIFATDNPHEAALAILDATVRFHDPAHADEWGGAGNEAAFERVFALLTAGLRR
jgi:AcrR family transcriptional regulator